MSAFPWLQDRTWQQLLVVMHNDLLIYDYRQAAWRELCRRMAKD